MNIGKAKCPNCSRDMTVTRLVCDECNIRVEAVIELPALTRLSPEDQLFVTAFVHSHGSIKQMERFFGVSYPTVKNRLARISSQLDPIDEFDDKQMDSVQYEKILDQLSEGDISVDEAIDRFGT